MCLFFLLPLSPPTRPCISVCFFLFQLLFCYNWLCSCFALSCQHFYLQLFIPKIFTKWIVIKSEKWTTKVSSEFKNKETYFSFCVTPIAHTSASFGRCKDLIFVVLVLRFIHICLSLVFCCCNSFFFVNYVQLFSIKLLQFSLLSCVTKQAQCSVMQQK